MLIAVLTFLKKYILIAIFAIIGTIILFVMIHSTIINKIAERKITGNVLLMLVTSDALNQYNKINGHFPAPKNDRLPTTLISPENYFTETYHNFKLSYPTNQNILPVDAFSNNGVGNNNYISVTIRDGGTIKLHGLPLRYGFMKNGYVLASNGPDGDTDFNVHNPTPDLIENTIYDITNGTLSDGDLVRFGGSPYTEVNRFPPQ